MSKLIVIEIVDKYDDHKVWVIKKYECGHYYSNLKIKGRICYSKFIRTTKKYLCAVLGKEAVTAYERR